MKLSNVCKGVGMKKFILFSVLFFSGMQILAMNQEEERGRDLQRKMETLQCVQTTVICCCAFLKSCEYVIKAPAQIAQETSNYFSGCCLFPYQKVRKNSDIEEGDEK